MHSVLLQLCGIDAIWQLQPNWVMTISQYGMAHCEKLWQWLLQERLQKWFKVSCVRNESWFDWLPKNPLNIAWCLLREKVLSVGQAFFAFRIFFQRVTDPQDKSVLLDSFDSQNIYPKYFFIFAAYFSNTRFFIFRRFSHGRYFRIKPHFSASHFPAYFRGRCAIPTDNCVNYIAVHLAIFS